MAAGFGGGMAVQGACGALVGAVMVLSHKYAIRGGHYCPSLRAMVREFVERFTELLSSQNCAELKAAHNDDCSYIIYETAKLLDEFMQR